MCPAIYSFHIFVWLIILLFLLRYNAWNLGPADEYGRSEIIEVKSKYIHKKYKGYTLDSPHDIAVLYLKRKIIFNKWVGPVCMPKHTAVETGEYLKAMGWGLLDISHRNGSDYLMKANLRVIDTVNCDRMYPESMYENSQICTYHTKKDSCKGDSGGPLVKVNSRTNMLTQHALVSFADSCNTTKPAVNTKVATFVSWIKDRITESLKNEQDIEPAELCY